MVADEDSVVGDTLVLGDALVEGGDLLFDVYTPVAGLDEPPHPQGGVHGEVARTPGAEAGGCDALVVGERVEMCRRLEV